MLKEAILPPKIMKSVYGVGPRQQRAAFLPGMVSLRVRELFPDITPEIYLHGDDPLIIRNAAVDALSGVDMDMIQPQHTVNVLCSEHGFNILGGEAYAEMLRTIKDIVQERTGCPNIRLKVAAGLRHKEPDELIEYYNLAKHFDGQAFGFTPYDKGVPIETEIGTMYGVAKAYNADWFIHAHYGDLRELYWHRMIDRSLKAFAMSYARLETRGAYHFNFGPRSGNFVARAIYNSQFIQQKFAFTCFLTTSPAGIIGVDADNDLNALDRRLTVGNLKDYGKLVRLFGEIDELIAVLDGCKWPFYQQAGGVVFGNLVNGHLDFFDLETVPAGTGFALFKREPGASKIKAVNPAVKAMVVNHVWIGMMYTELAINIPTIVVGRDLADLYKIDSTNPEIMNCAVTAENLEAAMRFARRISRTDKVLVFDGSLGSINLSPSLGEFMLKKAPEVSRNCDEHLLPMWLRQRGIDPEGI